MDAPVEAKAEPSYVKGFDSLGVSSREVVVAGADSMLSSLEIIEALVAS